MQKPRSLAGLRIFRTEFLPNPRARNRVHRRIDDGDLINPWGVGVGAVHDQVSDCYSSGNFSTWCKFATSGVSPDETAIKLCDKSNIVGTLAFRGQDHDRHNRHS